MTDRAKLQTLVDELEDQLDADRAFFRRNPGRRLWLRRPLAAELAIAELTGRVRPDYVMIEQVRPGYRYRIALCGRADPDVEWSDDAIELIVVTAANRAPA